MSLITVSNLSHNFGDIDIFMKVSFSIEKNSKIGLVGKNGSGKTTLFNIISKKIIPHQGNVQLAKNTKILYLKQDPDLNENQTLYECILESRPNYIKLSSKLEAAEKELAIHHSEENMKKYSEIQTQFEQIEGYHFRTEIKLVLTNLKFPESVWNQKISKFSGGEKTRIQLAKFLLQSFDLILLDEPTNHLDIEMIYWLENYLARLDKPYVIISHDRLFLDKTITKIIEIKNRSLCHYSGNYSFYQEESVKRKLLQKKEFKKQQKKIKQVEEQIKRYRIWGKARDSEVMYKRAKELEKRLDKMEITEKPKYEKSINLKIQKNKRSGNDVYTLENLSFGFPEKVLAEKVNLRIGYKDKIALLGRNGCGKTTFLRLLYEEMKPISGIAKKGASLDIGYYDQLHLVLDDSKTVMETIWALVPAVPKGYVFSYLAKFGFTGDEVEKKVSILSGGEKARLYLAKLIHEKPNFLILDEPTNHLDINMIANLEIALKNFDGTIIFVSHDRYFIEKVASKKWYFHAKNIIESELSLEELFAKKEPKIKKKIHYKKKKDRKTNPFFLKKIHDEIEENHLLLENKKEELLSTEGEFYDNSIYSDEKKVKSLTKKTKNLKEEMNNIQTVLNALEEKYLEFLEHGKQ